MVALPKLQAPRADRDQDTRQLEALPQPFDPVRRAGAQIPVQLPAIVTAGLFGDASNIKLVLGLAFILGGIITATQYR